MLLNTNVKLDLLHNIDMLNMIEKMKRGGLCLVWRNRYAKANNQHMPYYDAKKPSNYFIYEDANNLYGRSMSEYLPHTHLKFDNDIDLDVILSTPYDNASWYLVEVDVHFRWSSTTSSRSSHQPQRS